MKRIISIEGNIGSGKTTLFQRLRERSSLRDCRNLVFVEEPVGLWESIRDPETGESLLQRFYRDPERYAFAFQTMAFFSRLALVTKALAESPADSIVLTERSLLTDRDVFAKMLHDGKKIDDVSHQIYLHNSDNFMAGVSPDKIIYIKTDPAVCLERIAGRQRPGEGQIDLEYLTMCDGYHEKMMAPVADSTLTVDGNSDLDIEDLELFILRSLPGASHAI